MSDIEAPGAGPLIIWSNKRKTPFQGGDTRRTLPEGNAFERCPGYLACRLEGYDPSIPDSPELAVRVSAQPGDGLCPSWEQKQALGFRKRLK